ncbi:MAG: DUF1566 domain-containing protein [Candidatus Omnitrophota bacterium]
MRRKTAIFLGLGVIVLGMFWGITAGANMYDDANGNIGIGTTAPGAKLEIAGQVKITGGTPGLNKVLTSDDNGLASWETAAGGSPGGSNTQVQYNNSGSFGGDSGFVYSGSNVGIGTTAPAHKLEVLGASGVGIGTTAAGDALRIEAKGNVGIGTASPLVKLDVNGAVRIKVPKTSQTTSYRTGDDGDLEKGLSVLQDNGDGTVTDIRTGLMWPKDGTGLGYASGGTKTWNDAIDWALGLSFAGYDDWRLPNINELLSFQQVTWGHYQGQPTGYYWSSTTHARSTTYALDVSFGNGSVGHGGKTSSYYVVAVRGGE